jgi:hypothetical protein
VAFLDFIQEHKSAQQPSPAIQKLPDDVKAQAVETARPAAEIMGKGAQPQDAPVQPQPAPTPARGRSLGWER